MNLSEPWTGCQFRRFSTKACDRRAVATRDCGEYARSHITWEMADQRGCPLVCPKVPNSKTGGGGSLEINGQRYIFCATHYKQVEKSETGYPRFGLINDGVLPERFADKPEGEGKPCGSVGKNTINTTRKKRVAKKKVVKKEEVVETQSSDEKYDKLLKKETETHNENVWLKSKIEELEEDLVKMTGGSNHVKNDRETIKRLLKENEDLRDQMRRMEMEWEEATLPFTDPDEPQDIANQLVSEWIEKAVVVGDGRQRLRQEDVDGDLVQYQYEVGGVLYDAFFEDEFKGIKYVENEETGFIYYPHPEGLPKVGKRMDWGEDFEEVFYKINPWWFDYNPWCADKLGSWVA